MIETIVRFFSLEDRAIYSAYLNGLIDVDVRGISTCSFTINEIGHNNV